MKHGIKKRKLKKLINNDFYNLKSPMIKKKLINIGLIGCGIIGLRRLENLPSNFKLIGCSDPIILIDKIFKNKKDLFLTTNWRELISLKNLDAVIISTTHHLHSQIISECVNKNIHVFVEKPGGISAKETYKDYFEIKK